MSLVTNCRLCSRYPTVTDDYLCQDCTDLREQRRWAWTEEKARKYHEQEQGADSVRRERDHDN